MADADLAQLLGYVMHEWAEYEYTARGLFPVPLQTPVPPEE